MIGLMVNCTEQVAGAGSETTNGVTGCAVGEDGTPLGDATVKLIVSGHNPGNDTAGEGVLAAVTGSDGRFRFKEIKPGRYGIIARYKNSSLCGIVPFVQVPSGDSTVNVSECRLTSPGTVIIDFSKTGVSSGYCYFPGTDIFSSVDSTRKVYLHNVPPGSFDSLTFAQPGSPDGNVLRYELIVASQKTIFIDNPGWKNTRTLVLNTTSTGAVLTKDLFNIPVLLRLTGDNFDLTGAGTVPADLWFGSGVGRPVPFQIESWDTENKQAAIWIRIDTLYANSTTQTITMNWGNNFPVDSGRIVFTVFDTACGFQGIWHLSDSSLSNVKDATQNSYYGVSPDSVRPESVKGLIGDAYQFDGNKNYITMPSTASGRLNFSRTSSYTISAWVYVESTDDKSRVIVSKGNTQYFLWHTSIHLSKSLFEFGDFRDQSGWDLAVSGLTKGEWILLTGVHDGTSHILYANGVCVDTLIDYPFATLTRNNQSDLMIGRFAQLMPSPNGDTEYCFFKGKIDEVQISSVARSAEWIRFSYESQKTDSKLITFK
jgi:hypothetical protein